MTPPLKGSENFDGFTIISQHKNYTVYNLFSLVWFINCTVYLILIINDEVLFTTSESSRHSNGILNAWGKLMFAEIIRVTRYTLTKTY